MTKGDIAFHTQFPVIWDNIFNSSLLQLLTLTKKKTSDFTWPWKRKAIKNILRKGENAGNQYFLFFPHNVFCSS